MLISNKRKILLLSISGKDQMPEEPVYLNLFLASLKEHVVPYFDTKVILLDTSRIENSRNCPTYDKIKQYGLEEVVDLRTIDELDLPDNSVKYLKSIPWGNKIGLHMNILMDYSRRNELFDAEWIIHTDTDVQFLSDFKEKLDAYSKLIEVTPEILISLAGDAYFNNIRYRGTEFKFVGPDRIDFYEEGVNLPRTFDHMGLQVERGRDHYRTNLENIVMNVHQQKIRNDFVCISKQYAERWGHYLNWVACGYPDRLNSIESDDHMELKKWHDSVIDEKFILRINTDKGGWIQYRLKEGLEPGFTDVTHIQLPAYTTMCKHMSSGWVDKETFFTKSRRALEEHFVKYEHIWKEEYDRVG